jgi:putative tryptophan/tyrosine transport system substrate-binding protein
MRRREFIGLIGAASVAAPAHAQARPVIGFLHSGTAEQNANRVAGFLKGLAEAGFVDGQTVAIEYRWANGQRERLAEMAAELVRRPVAVIVTLSSQPATVAAREATRTIPIVFTWPGDPVAGGLVASLGRPGGNATGITTLNAELAVKRLGLLREVAPKARLSALLNPGDPVAAETARDLQAAARGLGTELAIVYAGNESEIDAAFATLAAGGASALLVNADPFFFVRRAQLVALAARHAVPTIYYDREFAVSGGLMTYGTDLPRAWGQAAGYVARILKGEKPGDLPVAQPTRFELVVNMKTAKTLGLEVPQKLLFTADEVME